MVCGSHSENEWLLLFFIVKLTFYVLQMMVFLCYKTSFSVHFFALQTKKAGKVFVIAGKCVILRANELTSSFNPAF